jgi:hypothetical protein
MAILKSLLREEEGIVRAIMTPLLPELNSHIGASIEHHGLCNREEQFINKIKA